MYIIDHNTQIALIREMKQLRKDTKKYEVYYHHPYTNQMWKSFFPKAQEESLGPKLLRHEPITSDVEERLQICLSESAPENAIGLGIEWSAKPELWPSIMQALENSYSEFNRKQLGLFIENLDLKERKQLLGNLPEQRVPDEKFSPDEIDNLIWRSRKIRMKRFFILG